MTAQSNGNNLTIQGRILWVTGKTLFEGKQKTDYNTNAPIFAADGSPKIEYGFGLAIPKIDPATNQQSEEMTKIWTALHNEAYTLFPSGNLPPDFAMKFKDGDGIDHKGQPFADREGYAGHIILTCTTQIPVKYFIFQGGNNTLVNTGIKCGDYVNVQLNIKAHPAKGAGKAGLYVNPSAVQLIQEGKEIVNTPSGDAIFGHAQPAYAGQVVAPVAPTAMPQAAPPVAAPAHYGVLPETHQPPMGNAAPMPTVAAHVAPVSPSEPTSTLPVIPKMPGM